MVMPTVVPTGFAGDYTDFLKVKCDRSGAVRRTSGTVTVPDNSTAGTVIGLFPFNSGMSFGGLGGYNIYSPDLDTASNATMSIGIAYQDTSAGTDNLSLVSTAASVQSAGYLPPTTTTWQDYVTTGNGWVVAYLAAGPVTTEGALVFNYPIAYDQPPLIA